MRKLLFIALFSLVSFTSFSNDGGLRSDAKLMNVSLNISNQSINIVFNTPDNNQIDNVYVMNLVGRKIDVQKYLPGTETMHISSSRNYPSGIYIIIAKDAQGKILESAKITINK